MNGADAEVAENAPELVASGCAGKVARDWTVFDDLCDKLRVLANDETLLVRGGAPVAVSRTSPDAPRALILDSDPAASCTYIGPQQYLASFYSSLGSAATAHFAGDLSGKLVVTCGMGAAGGAFVLAASLRGAASLGIEIDADRAKCRVKSGYCDVMVKDADEALRILKNAVRKREPASVGLVGDCGRVLAKFADRGAVPDLLANLTLPSQGLASSDAAAKLRSFGTVFADTNGRLMQGRELLRWVALSGEPSDIRRIDQFVLENFAADKELCDWIGLVQRRLRHFGLPARACCLTPQQESQACAAINDLVGRGEVKAPIAIIREGVPPQKVTDTGKEIAVGELSEIGKGAAWVAIHGDVSVSRVHLADGSSGALSRIAAFIPT